jgi:DNA repair protein RadC
LHTILAKYLSHAEKILQEASILKREKMEDNKTSIKTWPKSERPRELLLEKGPDYISDAGLIAVLLRTGIKNKDAVSLARDLIKQFGGLRGLFNATRADLEKIKGLGQAKIAQLMAAIELSKRQLKEEIIGRTYIESDKDVLDYLRLGMRDLKEEFFKIIYLNKANVILSVEDISKGTVDQASVYPREVVKRGLELNASGVIFVHNHPSGSLSPSEFDLDLTRALISACKAVGIAVLDHIIISPNGHVSLKSRVNL